jgi:hypothetical protein
MGPTNRVQGEAPSSDFGKLSRLLKNSAHTGNVDEKSQNAADATIAQDAQNGRPARPQRAKRRGVRFGTLSL